MRVPPPSASLLDPTGQSPIVAAMQWIEGVLLGELAVTFAVIAVAVVGLLFLRGRVAWGPAARVALGCALVFGAPAIVTGLMGSAERNVGQGTPSQVSEEYPPPREVLSPAEKQDGASLRRD